MAPPKSWADLSHADRIQVLKDQNDGEIITGVIKSGTQAYHLKHWFDEAESSMISIPDLPS